MAVFAKSMYTWPATVEFVELNFMSDQPGNGLFDDMKTNVLSTVTRDRFSYALFSMSQDLVNLRINHVAISVETFHDIASTAPTLSVAAY